MGATTVIHGESTDAMHHLQQALVTDDEAETEFHIRQALQLLSLEPDA